MELLELSSYSAWPMMEGHPWNRTMSPKVVQKA